MPVGHPNGDEEYMIWEFTRDIRTGNIDSGIIKVVLEVEIIQREHIERILKETKDQFF